VKLPGFSKLLRTLCIFFEFEEIFFSQIDYCQCGCRGLQVRVRPMSGVADSPYRRYRPCRESPTVLQSTNIFKRNLSKLQMRKVAYSLYRPCRESPTNTVSKENSACCRCGKSQTPCIAIPGSCRSRVLPFRGVFDPAYGRNGESNAAYGQYGKSRRFRWSEVDSLNFKRAPCVFKETIKQNKQVFLVLSRRVYLKVWKRGYLRISCWWDLRRNDLLYIRKSINASCCPGPLIKFNLQF
jgi:hypothetical protein